MLSISAEKIDSLFELIGSKQPLYLPVDNTSGKADFKKWEKGVKLSSALKTVRSAKDFFFPKAEKMVKPEAIKETTGIIHNDRFMVFSEMFSYFGSIFNKNGSNRFTTNSTKGNITIATVLEAKPSGLPSKPQCFA